MPESGVGIEPKMWGRSSNKFIPSETVPAFQCQPVPKVHKVLPRETWAAKAVSGTNTVAAQCLIPSLPKTWG
jgi:hypothetical protein